MRYELKTKVYRICDFSMDCYHPSKWKVVFVIDAKISNVVNVFPLDNSLYALEKTPCTPLCLAFALSYQQWLSSQGVLQVNLCHCESETS